MHQCWNLGYDKSDRQNFYTLCSAQYSHQKNIECEESKFEKKNIFFQKKQPTCFFKNPFFGFFKKKQDFVISSKKTEKAHSELFLFHHTILLFSELHNNNLLYLLWHSKLRVKQCTPSLISQGVVGQFTPKWKGLESMRTANREPTPTQTLQVSRQVYVHALLVQHLQSVFFQNMIWYVSK